MNNNIPFLRKIIIFSCENGINMQKMSFLEHKAHKPVTFSRNIPKYYIFYHKNAVFLDFALP